MMQVSVVCPVFNARPDELRAAADSALGQDCGTVQELILIDDCSTSPPTQQLLAELARAHPRIVLLRTSRNAGPAAARNLGLAHATADWIGFLDADDLWPADKIGCAVAALSQSPACSWLIGDFTNLRGQERDPVKPGASCFVHEDDTAPEQGSPALTRSIILDGLHLGTCLVRRDLIADLRFDPTVLFGEDLLFLAKLSLAAGACRAPGLSYLCRREHESMMYSPARLGARYASGLRSAMRDPALRAFRREYRWALYDVYKDLAVNNLLNHRRLTGLWFALHALRLDPREVRDIARFLSLLALQSPADISRRARHYSRREQFLLE